MNRRTFLCGLTLGLAAPLATEAQPPAMPLIGYLHLGSAGPFAYQIPASRQGLSETGYVEGKNVRIEYRWAEGMLDRLPALAADLVGQGVEVIAALGPPLHGRPKMQPRRSRLFSRLAPIQSRRG